MRDTRDVRAIRAERLQVDEEAALEQLIEIVLLLRRGRKAFEPITLKAVKAAKRLLGIESKETKERRLYWEISEGLGLRLEAIGIDAESGKCVDRERLRAGLKGVEQEEAMRLEEKYEGQDYEARKGAMREVLQRWRPSKAPRVASARHYLENEVLNRRIAGELRKELGE